MLHENPYSATQLNETTNIRGRVSVAVWWLVYLHPAITVALIYACWTLTTASLGRAPGFGEHPDNDVAHTTVHVLGMAGGLLAIASPVLIPVALALGLARPFARTSPDKLFNMKRVACVTVYGLLLVLVACVQILDPFGAMYWFWD